MSYFTTIPKKLIYDKCIRDVDIRMYLIISQNTNDTGFSHIQNDKLEKLSGKSRASIKRCLSALEESGHIVVKYNVKKNDIYKEYYDRVIWLSETYSDYIRKRRERINKIRTKENDFRAFVMWLKIDCKSFKFPVTLGGTMFEYKINNDGMLYRLSSDGEELLDKYDSNDVYLKIFRNKKKIFNLFTHESAAYRSMLEAMNTIGGDE